MSKVDVSVGPGFPVLLTTLLIALKLLGKITWSWFWVLSPLAIPVVVLLAIGCLAIVFGIFSDNRRFKG